MNHLAVTYDLSLFLFYHCLDSKLQVSVWRNGKSRGLTGKVAPVVKVYFQISMSHDFSKQLTFSVSK